jgi:hypothetical protein
MGFGPQRGDFLPGSAMALVELVYLMLQKLFRETNPIADVQEFRLIDDIRDLGVTPSSFSFHILALNVLNGTFWFAAPFRNLCELDDLAAQEMTEPDRGSRPANRRKHLPRSAKRYAIGLSGGEASA